MAWDVAACRATFQARWQRECEQREAYRQEAMQAVCSAAEVVFPLFPAVQCAYLFGSVIRPGALRVVSDIDIAIEGHLDAEDYFALWRELERGTPGWSLDLIELDRHSRFAASIRQQGVLIYARKDSDA